MDSIVLDDTIPLADNLPHTIPRCEESKLVPACSRCRHRGFFERSGRYSYE